MNLSKNIGEAANHKTIIYTKIIRFENKLIKNKFWGKNYYWCIWSVDFEFSLS